jgi:hypothetical protein
MQITNITRNYVKKISAAVNINILPQTKKNSGSVNNIFPKFREKIDDFREASCPFPMATRDIKLN